ncbi:AAA family ATPase [Arcicella rosea]|uniref:ABC-type lipoprotein export system ATPase subunit n=1 Tax=Arcicella rosea TaxID=502909 RepID=A0A841EUL8_9BACT|nr:AAA family ATPase [Arcicella rosea]MBB6005079.1 ABC-type lipoprotein export system ATPase subunit [Arcicella rosea]
MNAFRQNTDQFGVYLNKLYLKNVRCFKGNHEINLNDGNNKPIQWTVILGNNNVGKTTLLRALASLQFQLFEGEKDIKTNVRNLNIFRKYISFKKNFLFFGYQLLTTNNNELIPLKNSSFDDKGNILFAIEQGIVEELLSDWITNVDLTSFIVNDLVNEKLTYTGFLKDRDDFIVFGYGTSRMMVDSQSPTEDSTQGLFDNKTLLLNVEEWLKELHFAAISKIEGAEKRYNQVKYVLCNGLLPDVSDIRIQTIPDKSSYETFPEFLTSNDWVRMEDLGYGYQATLAWVADLAKRMFDTFPDLPNPLHGSSVVLVDEIDLHLHPEWQRKIIKYLSDLFPNVQFIVTAHSPLIIQSADNVNLIMLEKDDNPEGNGINIRQRFGSFQGWTIDEILTELMSLGERTRSDLYLKLMEEFENAILENSYENAQSLYKHLDEILSPSSYQRKVLQIQMSSLMPIGV